MADLRTQLALVLGVGLGLLLLAFPEFVVRANTMGRIPSDRRGEYGSSGELSTRLRRGVRIIGAIVLLISLYLWG